MSDCAIKKEGDEYVCTKCWLRWGKDEEQPPCPNKAVGKEPETIYVSEKLTLHGKVIEPGTYEIRRVV